MRFRNKQTEKKGGRSKTQKGERMGGEQGRWRKVF